MSLGYGEPKVLEVLMNTLPIEDLRQLVETAKRTLTKEKLDRQPVGQTVFTPCMSTSSVSRDKNIKFDSYSVLNANIDKLTAVMSKLNTQNAK